MTENQNEKPLMLTGRQIRKMLGNMSMSTWYKLCKKKFFTAASYPACNRLYPYSQVLEFCREAEAKKVTKQPQQ